MPHISGRAWLLAALLVAGALAIVAWLLTRPEWRDDPSPQPEVGAVEVPMEAEPARTHEGVANDPVSSPVWVEEVISNPDCRLVVGQRSVSDTALVIVPFGEGAWFAVVDALGVVFDGTLPFLPARHVLGKRTDGTVLVGLELDGRLRIVHDGHSIFELDEAWRFDIPVSCTEATLLNTGLVIRDGLLTYRRTGSDHVR